MTILKAVEDDAGRIIFETDIPADLALEERIELIARLQFGMMTHLRGRKELSVYSAIKSLGIASLLLTNDMDEAIRDFDEEAARLSQATREGVREMKAKGAIIIDTADERHN